MTEARREHPTDSDLAEVVAGSRGFVMAEVSSRRAWWRRLSRSTVVVGVVGTVAAGGIAYAAVDRAGDEPPETNKGNAVFEIGTPGAGDKWLNFSMTYYCKPGEKFSVRDRTHELASGGCRDSAERGIRGSRRASEIDGTKLVVTSDISREYRFTATWGPRASMESANVLPPIGTDGKPEWDMPTYTVNEYGLTVGVPTIHTPESAWPDLYPVTFQGEEAYFIKTDMIGQDAGNPEEAGRQMKERRRLGLDVNGKSYRFVYAADGKTRLGKKYIGSYSSH